MGLIRGLALASALLSASASAIRPMVALAAPAPSLTARAATLIEQTTGQELYGSNVSQELPIASTTKLMTALLTLEHVRRLGTIFTESNYYPAAAESQIGLMPGERMSVHDLLLALLLPSANDAAEDLAYNVGHGSIPYFIAMMNAQARELGLSHTHYSTPSGLDTPGNYSSASDLVTLTRYLETHEPFFVHAVSLPSAVLRTGAYVRHVINRNDLVRRVAWIDGVKTGYTRDASYVLVSSATRNGMRLISAVLGAPSQAAQDSNTLALLNYGFAGFRLVRPVVAGSVVARPTVRDQPGMRAEVIAARSVTYVVSSTARLRTRIALPRELAGPRRRGAVVGEAVLTTDGRTIARVPLLLVHALPAVSPLTLVARFITRPFTLVSLVVLLGGAIALAVLWRERARARAAVPPEPAA